MKTVRDLAKKLLPAPQMGVTIELLIRHGKATPLPKPIVSEEMLCQDCLGYIGYTTLHYGKRAWFCGNMECLEKDTGIK